MTHSLCVLVVDDDRVYREMIAGALVSEGHVVRVAGTRAEGEAQFKRGLFDVVLHDVDFNDDEPLDEPQVAYYLGFARPRLIVMTSDPQSAPANSPEVFDKADLSDILDTVEKMAEA